tara:strand:- start:43 stop:267 length:225 start_codon:yes stop_codon:yes gene_type:complete
MTFKQLLADTLEQWDRALNNSTDEDRSEAYHLIEGEPSAGPVGVYYLTDYICYRISHEGDSLTEIAAALRQVNQ